MNASTFNLPDVGEGLTEAEVVTWRVAEGDVVKVNDVLVDIETAKSIVELPSPFAGTVTGLLVGEGETVPVGTPIITIGAASPAAPPQDQDPPFEAPAETRQPVLVGYGPRSGATTRRRKKSASPVEPVEALRQSPPDASVPGGTSQGASAAQGANGVRVLAKPPVRKLAKDLGVDLASVPAAGPIVTRAEVEAFARGAQPQAAPTPTSAPSVEGDVRVPVKGVRKATAEAMVASAFTAPHVTEWVTVDVSRTVELVDRLKADRRFADVKVTPTLLVARAVCLALRRTPQLNASWDEAAQEIVLRAGVNLGVAAATERGLVVPVVPAADRMSLADLGTALGELTRTAREGRTQPAQMSGGTFTLTNVGVFGVDGGTPILNPGQSGILAVGAIARRPWVDENDVVVPRWVTTLSVSFDHRVADGEQGSRFLADVAAMLHDPALALTF
ncbi:branched-chain alpha-keto acid dehydrogenase subunit E2 [Aeromicrobium sp. Root495]|uniref:dihydrolipoamide acetyltransferase family protein n=1 Tax=Aeromicrobium sp. Root495 TaxID=1736550 RepID=UPI0006F9B2F9|nr:dihydrolipoamide acetyltransferase family protein [Aeromicrobium sp. Root495]KQY56043.1 branched-chain alpha-keto acid dehydrogenase subunit E2 [Aeromicrobium sp. Root495]